MKKPKLVCVLGSATLAPLSFVAMSIATGLLLWLLRVDVPVWLNWVGWVIAITSMPWTIPELYRWFFQKCYRPPADR